MKNVIDINSNRDDIIANAAKELKGAPIKINVFKAIYRGKQKTKTQADIVRITGMNNVRILQECDKLKNTGLIQSYKKDGKFVFEKVPFIKINIKKILRLSENKENIKKFINEYKQNSQPLFKLSFAKKSVQIKQITIDDIDSFSKVKQIKSIIPNIPLLYEKKIKIGIQKIIGQKGDFTDWGGEKGDLYSTRTILNGKRIPTAFAFKGKGTKSKKLVLANMGKNGDQVQRLFYYTANLFIIMFQGEIDEAITEQMKICAISKSYSTGEKIFYCVIDKDDTIRIISAYKKYFS